MTNNNCASYKSGLITFLLNPLITGELRVKKVNLTLPESGLALIDCEKSKVLDVLPAIKNKNGIDKLPPRILFTRINNNKWRHIPLKKGEFICSLNSLKDAVKMAMPNDSTSSWF